MKKAHQLFLNTYEGQPVTMRELAESLKVSYKTIRNQKALWESRGINFITASEEKKSRVTYLDSSVMDTLPTTDAELTKQLCNLLCSDLGLPFLFEFKDLPNYFVKRKPTRASLKTYLTKALANPSSKLTFKEKVAIQDLISYKSKVFISRVSQNERDLIVQVFQDLFSFNPTEEQIKCVHLGVKHLTAPKVKTPLAQIQSAAGASKSTCIRVMQEVINRTEGYQPLVVSTTHRAVKGFPNAQTVAKRLTDVAGMSTFKENDELVKQYIDLRISQGVVSKIDTLIVDEYTLLSNLAIESLILSSKRILFVGDSEQLRNCTLTKAPVLCSLTEQFRFTKSESTIQETVTVLHNEKRTTEVKKMLNEVKVGGFGATIVPEKDGTVIESKSNYKGHFNKHQDLLAQYRDLNSQIVAYSKLACAELNTVVNGGENIKVGSKVVISRKDYRNPVAYPGDVAQVLSIDNGKARCITKDNETFTVSLGDISLGYAITSVTAQGSAWDNVLAVLGTSNAENFSSDAYSIITRASRTVKVLLREDVDTSLTKMFDILDAEEGNRNNSLYASTKVMKDYAVRMKGLEENEVEKTSNSALNTKTKNTNKTAKVSKANKEIFAKGDKRYGLIINGVNPTAEQCVKTKAEAEYMAAVKTAQGFDIIVTENLGGGNRVVVDLDCKEAVEIFKDQLDKTEAYISEESVHLVYTTDKVLATRHASTKAKIKGDFLGNKTNQTRRIKNNKVYNGKEATPLPDEVYERLISLL